MATNIDIRSLNAMFNDYLKNSSGDQEFVDYCLSRGYFHRVNNTSTTNYEFDFSKFRKNKFVDTSSLTSDPEKYRSYLAFLSYLAGDNSVNRIDNDKAVAKTLMDLIEDVPMNAGLGLSRDESEELYNKYLRDSKHKMKKMHPKTAFAAKKIGIPTLITTAVCAVVGGAIAASGLVAGALPFLTDSLFLNITSLATLGAFAGAIITPIVIIAKNAIVRSYYARKYGTKTNNLSIVLNSGIENVADIENLNLPINELFKKFKKTQEKIEKKKHSKNPFSRLANFFREKTNRNRLHEIMNVLKKTNAELKTSQDPATREKLGLFQRYLVDQTKNLELSRKYADIIARSRVDKKERNRIANLKSDHKDYYKQLAINVLSKDPYTPSTPSILQDETNRQIVENENNQSTRRVIGGGMIRGASLNNSFIDNNKNRSLEDLYNEYAFEESDPNLQNNNSRRVIGGGMIRGASLNNSFIEKNKNRSLEDLYNEYTFEESDSNLQNNNSRRVIGGGIIRGASKSKNRDDKLNQDHSIDENGQPFNVTQISGTETLGDFLDRMGQTPKQEPTGWALEYGKKVLERNRIELKQAEAKRIEEQKKRVEQRQKAEQQSQKTEEGKTQGKTAKTTIPQSPKQQPSPTPIPKTTNNRRKRTQQEASKVKRGFNAKTTLEDDDNTPSITPAPSVPANDKKTGRSIPKSNNKVSKANNPPKNKSKIDESENNTTDTSAEKTQATQPRGKRKQNSSTAPTTPIDETTEHSTRPSRSSILRQSRKKTLSPQTLEQSSAKSKSTRSKTSEGAKNALDALAENIAKLTTQTSQQDNHPTYTQADVENFLKKSGNKVSDNEVTIKVRGGDVTINGNPLENTEI